MRLIIINRKKLGITVIIVGLMLIILGLEARFEQRLKMAALVQSNISSLKLYSALDNKFTYKIPSNWVVQVKQLGSTEIIYHSDFASNNNVIHGVVEVWNYKQDLKSFLDSSRELSSKENVVKNYNINSIKINGYNGYLVNYDIMTSKDVYHRAYEYFIKVDQGFVRFSFFVRTINFTESMPNIFKIITETFEYKE